MKRFLIVVFVATLFPLLPVAPASVAVADTCQKYGWVKYTFRNNLSTTYAEIREQAWWRTSGTVGSCWTKGLYDGTYVQNSNLTYCYANRLAALAWISIDQCSIYPSSTYWYTDGMGRARYIDYKWRTTGNYSYAGSAGLSGAFVMNAQFTIRWDNTFTKNCYWSGAAPVQTNFSCTYGRGTGTGA